MQRLTLILVGLLFTATASAQVETHLYGGGILGGVENTRGFLGGVGFGKGPAYAAVDGHGLRFKQEELQRLANETVTDITVKSYGVDFSIGGALKSDSEKFKVMPVGIVGYTTGDVKVCLPGSAFCADEKETQVNFGAGLVTVIKGKADSGLHLGARYTRNYGFAVTVGFVFPSGQ